MMPKQLIATATTVAQVASFILSPTSPGLCPRIVPHAADHDTRSEAGRVTDRPCQLTPDGGNIAPRTSDSPPSPPAHSCSLPAPRRKRRFPMRPPAFARLLALSLIGVCLIG